jgi:hypothetical protein
LESKSDIKDTKPQSTEKTEIVRYEADSEKWIEDHTGVKRKPF